MNKVKLGDLLEVKRGTTLSSKYYSKTGSRKRLTLGNFNYPNGGFKENMSKEDIFFIGDVKSEYILKKDDIITPLTEQVHGLLGETARIPIDDVYVQSGDIGLVIPNSNKLDNKFAYYLISSPVVKKQLSAGAQQTKIRHTSPDKIKDCQVYLPDLSNQKKIGVLLNNIDHKIKINNKINDELEAMAKTIYDYWFLQFEFPNEEGKPYKSSGGKMVWNEELKREIPEGWEVKTLYDIADYINGLACQKYRPINKDNILPVIKIVEMHNGITSNTEYVRDDIPLKNIIDTGDILFSWSASLEVTLWKGKKAGLNQHIFKVVPKFYPKYYIYMQLSAYIINFIKIAETRKTTMGHITIDHLKQSKILLSNIKLAKTYDIFVKDLFEKILLNNIENQELTSLRDFLLPLLMNGQVGFKGDKAEG